MQSLISVIVNYHNGEKYLERCIKSIISQEYKNFEIIAWDNASTDNSKKIIEKFKEAKIRYFRHPIKENLYKARNRAIEKSSGQLIAFLDSDDWGEENDLAETVPQEVKRWDALRQNWDAQLINPIFLGLIHTERWQKRLKENP